MRKLITVNKSISSDQNIQKIDSMCCVCDGPLREDRTLCHHVPNWGFNVLHSNKYVRLDQGSIASMLDECGDIHYAMMTYDAQQQFSQKKKQVRNICIWSIRHLRQIIMRVCGFSLKHLCGFDRFSIARSVLILSVIIKTNDIEVSACYLIFVMKWLRLCVYICINVIIMEQIGK